MVDYVRTTSHTTRRLVGVANMGGLGKYHEIYDLSNLSFFLFSSPRAQVAFLNRSGRPIHQNACFKTRMCLLGASTIT